MRAKGKGSVRVADILNRMQVEEPVNTNDVKYVFSAIRFNDFAILYCFLLPSILNDASSIPGGKA